MNTDAGRLPQPPQLDDDTWTTLGCPECGHLAEVDWSTRLGGTGGGVEHLKIRCVNKHWFFMPTDLLAARDR